MVVDGLDRLQALNFGICAENFRGFCFERTSEKWKISGPEEQKNYPEQVLCDMGGYLALGCQLHCLRSSLRRPSNFWEASRRSIFIGKRSKAASCIVLPLESPLRTLPSLLLNLRNLFLHDPLAIRHNNITYPPGKRLPETFSINSGPITQSPKRADSHLACGPVYKLPPSIVDLSVFPGERGQIQNRSGGVRRVVRWRFPRVCKPWFDIPDKAEVKLRLKEVKQRFKWGKIEVKSGLNWG